MTIIILNINDVKIGGGNRTHPGNIRYNNLISTHKKEFVIARVKKDRKKVDSILNTIYKQITTQCTPPGRFVAKNQDGSYIVKGKEFALGKMKKALGENNAVIRDHLKLRGVLPDSSTPIRILGEHQISKRAITRQDLLKLHYEIGQIDESKIKQIRRHQK